MRNMLAWQHNFSSGSVPPALNTLQHHDTVTHRLSIAVNDALYLQNREKSYSGYHNATSTILTGHRTSIAHPTGPCLSTPLRLCCGSRLYSAGH
jgi:hypothetical protein